MNNCVSLCFVQLQLVLMIFIIVDCVWLIKNWLDAHNVQWTYIVCPPANFVPFNFEFYISIVLALVYKNNIKIDTKVIRWMIVSVLCCFVSASILIATKQYRMFLRFNQNRISS